MNPLWDWIIDHLTKNKGPYVLLFVIVLGFGITVGSAGQQVLTQLIDERVDTKMVEALNALEEKVGNVDAKVERLNDSFSELKELLLVRSMQEVQMEICRAPARHLRDQLLVLQQQYRQLTGTTYRIESCEMLLRLED